jgi:hypothetical protein
MVSRHKYKGNIIMITSRYIWCKKEAGSEMAEPNQQSTNEFLQAELNHPEWDEPIICRVEVDLPAWLTQLAGGHDWEVYSEDEEESCVSFAMRQGSSPNTKNLPKLAEVTLYHNGYAIVDVDGQSIFDGSLTSGANECAHLSYYHADSGKKITLN